MFESLENSGFPLLINRSADLDFDFLIFNYVGRYLKKEHFGIYC